MKKLLKICSLCLALSMFTGLAATSAAAASDFADVKETDYFYPAVEWGVEAGVTDGVGDNKFDPEGKVNRAQVVTFLWRMQGQPAPEGNETFADVEKDSWYETAVKWAVENKITLGTGDNEFSPYVTCDRAMCMTLLYRIMGEPIDELDAMETEELTAESTLEDLAVVFVKELVAALRDGKVFSDVPSDAYYANAVLWGALNGIITEDNTGELVEGAKFRPTDPCVRKEMISFLYQNKLAEDEKDAPAMIENGIISVPVPQEYQDLLYTEVNAIPDDEDGVLVTVSELASREAAMAAAKGEGKEADEEIDVEGIGELFSIERVSEAKVKELLCGDMSGIEVFAKDEKGNYYLFVTPTDVRYERETPEKMAEDQEQWTKLNEWARNDVRKGIIENSEGLTEVTYSNTLLDIYLAQIAYGGEKNYTVSTTEFGPLKPGKVDPTAYAEALLAGNFVEVEDAEAPDGEYVVLELTKDKIRYDFFKGDENLVREVRGKDEVFYRRAAEDEVKNTAIMQNWYDALAIAAGKKTEAEAAPTPKADAEVSAEAFIGKWHEIEVGRGSMTIEPGEKNGEAIVTITWADSASKTNIWEFAAAVDADGDLSYENGKHIVKEFKDEADTEGKVVSETKNESGYFKLGEDGQLTWNAKIKEGEFEKTIFIADEEVGGEAATEATE